MNVLTSIASKTFGSLKYGINPAIIPRVNPFKTSPLLPLRDFKTFQLIDNLPFAQHLFSSPINSFLMHADVVRYRAALRAGLASTKNRGEVRGSGRKIHPQKGSGRARAGSSRAPHRRGGGVCFGPRPRSFAFKMPRKMILRALTSALSSKYKISSVSLFNPLKDCEFKKTKELAVLFNSRKILIVHTSSLPVSMLRCGRSLKNLKFHNIQRDSLETYSVLNADLIFISLDSEQYFTQYIL